MAKSPILQLDNSDHWEKVHEVRLQATEGVLVGTYQRIPLYNIPIDFDRHTLAFGTNSFFARPTWTLGCWVVPSFRTAIGRSTLPRIPVAFGLNIMRFPYLAPAYRLQAVVPKWMIQLDIDIWKYTGAENDVLDVLDVQRERLDIIEAKIDGLG